MDAWSWLAPFGMVALLRQQPTRFYYYRFDVGEFPGMCKIVGGGQRL